MINLLKQVQVIAALLTIVLTIGIANNSYALPPYLHILIPSANTTWTTGTSGPIIWTDNISSNVVIKLYKGNTFITTVAANTPSDGSHTFPIPTTLATGTDYRLHIAEVGNPSLASYSSYFTITGNNNPTPNINITNPTSNTVWNKGQTVNINWTDNISSNVQIHLLKGNNFIASITNGTPSDGSHTYTVPNSLPNGNNYRIRIYDASNSTTFDTSPYFTITGVNGIQITNPTSGTTWNAGQSATIQWLDDISENVRIQIYQGNNLLAALSTSTPSDGSFTFTVPLLLSGNNFRIKITSVNNSTIFDYSDYFTIAPVSASINVTSPTTGTIWNPGQTRTIQWTDNISSNVRIELYKGGTFNRTITSSTLSDGAHTYTVPSNLVNGSNYRVKITSVSDASVYDFSNYFSISNVSNGSIVINSPVSNDVWTTGQHRVILWSDNISSNVRIELYKGLNLVNTIIHSTPSDGSYTYTIPNHLASGTNYRIKIYSLNNPSIADFSDFFTINNPNSGTITITNPTGSTVWTKGQSVTVQWTDNITSNVGIQLYKGGTSPVHTIIANTPSDGSHTFVLPNHLANGSNYQVHIYDVNNTSTQTSSPLFTITGSTANINITNPSSGTVWIKGQTRPIIWTDNISNNVRIQLYKENSLVETIVGSTPSDGLHTYTVSTSLSNSSRYRVRIFDVTNSAISDYSDYFTITSFIDIPNPSPQMRLNNGQSALTGLAFTSANPQHSGQPSYCMIETNEATNAAVTVADLTGKVVQQKTIALQKGENALTIDALNTKGIYIVSIQTATDSKQLKLVITD